MAAGKATGPKFFETASPGRRAKEIRVGLVMYGGVSLAIYTYGVSREFFDAVKGHGIYGALKELLDADIVLDVLSGTSAGGVNAVMLSRALAAGGDFAIAADVWRDAADIGELLQDPLGGKFEKGEEAPRAFFRSDAAYRDKLRKLFQRMRGDGGAKRGDNETPLREIDTMITTTSLGGRQWTQLDSRGQPLVVRDHRTFFRLRHRASADGDPRATRSDFYHPDPEADDIVCDGLAQIARSTSAFPVAFHPVEYVTPEERRSSPRDYHDVFSRSLQGRGFPKRSWFIDGGVLDNKPFTHASRVIFYRSADRPVDRKLFYVEPDPETLHNIEREQPQPESVALAALVTIPSYETISNDLEAIRARNRTVSRLRAMAAEESSGQPIEALNSTYYRARGIYLAEALERAFQATGDRPDPAQTELMVEEIRARLAKAGKDPARVDQIDVAFHMRRHFQAIYAVLGGWHTEQCDDHDRGVLAFLYGQVKILQIADYVLGSMVREFAREMHREPSDTGTFLNELERRAHQLLNRDGLNLPPPEDTESSTTSKLLGDLYSGLGSRLKQTPDASESGETQPLTLYVTERSRQVLANLGDCPSGKVAIEAFNGFDAVDQRVFPLQVAGEVHEMDEIELVRISPRDTSHKEGFGEIWGLNPLDKIAGDALFHFGGFIKRSWRSNDIFWGRMDAMEILIDTLLPKDVELESTHIARALDALVDWLTEEERKSIDPTTATRDEVAGLLIRAARRSIALEETPSVAKDRAREAEAKDPEALAVAVRERLERAREAGWAHFDSTVEGYLKGLGSQTLGHVSGVRLLQYGSQAAHLATIILKVRGKGGGMVAKGLAWVARALGIVVVPMHVLARALGFGAVVRSLVLAALMGGLVVAGLMVALNWPGSIGSWVAFGVLIILCFVARMTIWNSLRRKK